MAFGTLLKREEICVMSSLLRWVTLLVVLALSLWGCTTVPTLSEHQVIEEYDAISAFKGRLGEDLAKGRFDLAPKGFARSQEILLQAISLGRTRNNEKVAKTLAEGWRVISKAEADANVSKALMREVLEARSLAIEAGADTLQEDRFKALDNKLRIASQLVEEGDPEAAKKWRPELLDGYSQIELEALKQEATENARKEIQLAEQNEADEYAPKTLKHANNELTLAIAVLETNRSQREKARNHALQASKLARRSIEITELIKDFDSREFTPEDILLWYQNQLTQINEPLSEELPFDQPNHEVVQILRDKLKHYVTMQRTEMATRIDLETRLATMERQNREAQERFDKIQRLFSSEEANVYRQGHNVLLELHAFNFPSGGADIQAENFALLDKIITAVNTFPNPNVVVSGHTDSVGSAETNLTLSQQRAETVASFLEKLGGVKRTRLTAIGYGETRPVANNETEEGRKTNRRIEVLIINE
jgi:OmpA-OmpF porin, OOP family